MRRIPTIYFVLFLLIFMVLNLPAYADLPPAADPDLPSLTDQSQTSFLDNDSIANLDTIVPDLFTGSLRYSIPISLPAGRNGLTPKVALTYQSTQQNGWLGLGWELEVGSIERNTRKGVDYNGDSYILRMNGATTELVNINGAYQEKIQNAFFRITAYKDSSSQPTYWEVTDKKGIVYRFGETADARQDDPANGTTTRVFKWCLNKITDPNGNYINYSYAKNQGDQGQIYLKQIDYTGNGTKTPTNTVTFVRESGNFYDLVRERGNFYDLSYRTNFLVETTYRLQSIEVKADGKTVRSYKLGYTTSAVTSQTLLTTVQQFGSDGVSKLPAITLQYSPDATFGVSSWPLSVFQWHLFWWQDTEFRGHNVNFIPKYNYSFGDFNGDGRTDALVLNVWDCPGCSAMWSLPLGVWMSSGNDFSSPAADWQILDFDFGRTTLKISADFNGDKKADVLFLPDGTAGSGNMNVSLNTGANSFASYMNWLTISPFDSKRINIADVDGDGKMDLVYIEGSGNLQVSLSSGTNFVTQAAPANMSGIDSIISNVTDTTRYRFADFNGDGKTDVVYIDSSGKLWVALSTGTGFATPQNWQQMGNGSNPSQYAVADFNGDGKVDIVYVHNSDKGGAYPLDVALSTGSSFAAAPGFTSSPPGNGDITRYKFFDFDGNGKADLLYLDTSVNPANPVFFLSTGSRFVLAPGCWTGISSQYASFAFGQFHVGDFNGDGRVDMGFLDWSVPQGSPDSLQVVSFHGPTDNPNEASNLLVNVSNGIGGSTTIAYKPSTEYANTQLPFPVQTVSSIKTDDGNGNVAETKYSYEGGYYLPAEREFRGFNHVTVTGPAGPNLEQKISETWFYQGIGSYVCHCSPCPPGVLCKPCGCGSSPPPADSTTAELKGKAYHTRVKDVNSAIYSEITITYRGNIGATGFFYSPETVSMFTCDGSTTTSCDATTSGQSKMTKYGYDSYGNATLEQIFTSANAPAPYRTTIRDFTTDSTDNYIVGLPKYETISDASGQKIASTAYYYDDPSDCEARSTPAGYTNQVPTQGNVTTIVRWFKEKTAGQTDPEINMSYEYGNLVCTRDGNGHTSRMKYDLATSTYPTEKTNAKGHTTKTEYYGVNSSLNTGVYGQVARVIDPNPNASTTFEYDALGRKTNVIDPYGAVQNYTYPGINDYGSAETRHVKTTSTVNYSSSATIWKEVYFDGFGRTVKTRSQGPENNKVIRLDTVYDRRGAVLSSSLPYFEGASASVRTFKYDTMGRVLERTDPGVTGTSETCYQNGVTVQVDLDGNKKRETKDIFGRLVQVDEYDPGYPFTSCTTVPGSPYATTTYVYDEMGNLRFVNDVEGNQTEMRYDSLGRKYYMKDPDMGVWGYSYDTNNNLVSQTDANHRTIIFHYDELNRVTWKEYPKNLPLVMTDVNYTYDVAPDGSAVTSPIGRLARMTDASGTTNYYYDMLGRTAQTSKAVDNVLPAYTIKTSYDPLGRLASITYPDTETVNYVYNAGVLSAITGAVSYATYAGYNALGQPGTITYGNGISTNYTYDPLNYRLKSILTGNADQSLINLTYGYFDGGNIKNIVDGVDSALTQWFEYDGLSRIQHAQTPNAKSYGGVSDLYYGYSPTGNINFKERVTAAYNYTDSTGLHPHAVKTANGMNYSYDANGNLKSESTGSNVYRAITYDYDNMPISITVNNKAVGFVYDGSGSRVKKIFNGGENIYLGKLYECREGVCTKYIFAGDTRMAMKTGADVLYYHQDHLGSTQAITQTGAIQSDLCSSQPVRIAGTTLREFPTLQAAYNAASNGDVIQARAVNFTENLEFNGGVTVTINGGYDCGYTSQVENSELVGSITANTGQVTIGNFEIVTAGYSKYRVEEVRYRPFGETLRDVGDLSVTHKYTSQEFDAETGLYNYNARFYNPALGRFISADSQVPDFTNPQSLNRYSYVLNNPLRMVDPTGHDEDEFCWDNSWMINWDSMSYNFNTSSNYFGSALNFTNNYFIAPFTNFITFGAAGQFSSNLNQGNYFSAGAYFIGGVTAGVWTLSTLPIQETARAIGAGGEIVAEEAATLYRAVSKSELDDIAARGLQLKPGGYESKLFATSFEDAVTHGRDLYNVTSVPFNVVEISFPKSMLNQFESLTLDFKPAVNVPGTMLPSLNSSMTWKYFPYLPLP